MNEPLEIAATTDNFYRNDVTSETDLTSLDVEWTLIPEDGSGTAVWHPAEWTVDGQIRWHYQGDYPPGVYRHWVRIDGGVSGTPLEPTGLVLLIDGP